MLKVVITLLMLAVAVTAIAKKFHGTTVLFVVALITFAGITIISKESILGEATNGSKILDLFEYMYETIKKAITGSALTVMFMIGYVELMKSIKATDMFTVTIAKPLGMIKNKYILATIVILVGFLLKLVIPNATSLVPLLIATIYPILLRAGCSRATCASAITLSVTAAWGPADTGLILALNLAQANIDIAEYFVTYQLLITLLVCAVMMVVFFFVAKFFDKKESALGAEEAQEYAEKSADEIGVPKFYAVLPLLPLLFIIIFSKLVAKTIIISAVAAVLVSLLIAMLVHILTFSSKNGFKNTFNDIHFFNEGMGQFWRTVGLLVIAGTFFAAAINKVGGMAIIVNWVVNAGGGAFILVFLAGFMMLAVVAATSAFSANMNVLIPFVVSVAGATNLSVLPMVQVIVLAGAFGVCIGPASGSLLVACGSCNVDVTTVIKRNIIVVSCGTLALILFTFLFNYM